LTYWFPKMFGFTLNERLGRLAAYAWQIGYILAFVPLYILGLMGAVRRLDHYLDPTWTPLFIVSAIGVLIIALGVGIQMLQLAYSIWKRKENLDTTGDPWDGRTLEWSVPSPAPHYNFAIDPVVTERDDFWYSKHKLHRRPHRSEYSDIELPKNTSSALFVAVAGGLFCFGIIWHIWWLMIAMTVYVVIACFLRSYDEDTEYTIGADELFADDAKRFNLKGTAV